jgi:excisionase family DNA binding protein
MNDIPARTRPSTAAADAANQELLTITEVAQMLRVPVATLRYWRHLGAGPNSFRIGRHVRYRRSDVRAWLNAKGRTR